LLLLGVLPYVFCFATIDYQSSDWILRDFGIIILIYAVFHLWLGKTVFHAVTRFSLPFRAVIFISRFLRPVFQMEEYLLRFFISGQIFKRMCDVVKEDILQLKMQNMSFEPEIREGAQEEINIIRNLDMLFSKPVQEVMTPWRQVVGLDNDACVDDAFVELSLSGFSRFPVVDENNRPIGIYRANHLELLFDKKLPVVAKMVDEISVDGNESCFAVLQKLRRHKRQMAHVYADNNVVGVVTMEDIFEEMVGEIEDEFDTGDFRQIADDLYIADASLDLSRVLDYFDEPAPDTKARTLNGFLIEKCGSIPMPGTVVSLSQMKIMILKRDDRKISRVRIQALK
jgi:CBS domain containing-hemolysin-like protein